MEGSKVWYCRWSERKNKVFYVNIKSRESCWIKPDGFIESEDELKKIAEWKLRKRKSTAENSQNSFNEDTQLNANKTTEKLAPLESKLIETSELKKQNKTTRKRSPKHSLDENFPKKRSKMTSDCIPDTIKDHAGDYVQVFSEKRQMHYYYNMKTKSSQWKRPACFQAAETEKAIENANLKKSVIEKNTVSNGNLDSNLNDGVSSDDEVDNNDNNGNNDHDNDKTEYENMSILNRSTLNANAPCFEMGSKLNVDAPEFVPRPQILKTLSCNDLTDSKKEENATYVKPKSRRKGNKRKVTLIRRSDPTPQRKSTGSPHSRLSAKERLSLSGLKSGGGRSVHDRLGTRPTIHSPESSPLLSEAVSNVRIPEKDLIKLSDIPPHPDTEVLRYTEVQALRHRFSNLCQDKLGLEEPTEALNRWLLEQKLNCTEHIDPFFSFSDEKKTVSMYREIMEDFPMKFKLPRQVKTCTKTLAKFVERMEDLAKEWKEKDVIAEKCEAILTRNTSSSDTRTLMSELRESCREIIEKHYKVKVDEVCRLMNEQCKESAVKVREFCRKRQYDETITPPSICTSTRLVGCSPATPLVSVETSRDTDVTVSYYDTEKETSCRISYQGNMLAVNRSHFLKLESLYKTTNKDSTEEDELLNCRIWCLLKRYKMLRASIAGTKLQQENFGLHAALPHKAFDLLNRRFHVTFECFASPFNCYFPQYCSAFPDIDCYFGSRGSFFDFKPKSGSFQANPPFSEEVMLAMANHMISLLDDSTEPLRFVIFIPDWREPMTPAIPRLENTIYLTHNILLNSRTHQYITGNQHLQSITHYDACHGTQVYVIQNDAASDHWPLDDNDMYHLRDAMSYNRAWN